ncbi:MAG TPA: class I SAM-dependent methyltransferase [Chryseosolibacter sp.]
MKDTLPLFNRITSKAKMVFMFSKAKAYMATMRADNPLRGIPVKVVGDVSADPTEFFNHYDAFAFWTASKLNKGGRKKILDVGSPKMMCAMFSAEHDVTSLVLADCKDSISAVKYIKHDVCDPLPFEPSTFDVFTSSAALQLVGLGRYGDKVDANCLPNLVSQLERVVKPDGDLFISICLGPNRLAYNNSWFLDMPTITTIFGNWRVIDSLVDGWSSPRTQPTGPISERFSKSTSVDNIALGDYRVVFLHFKRK